ncbi:DUF3180 domain-containing protein [Nocardia asteroides]|uniref:DUF3180 domain-containing protein n=1 Tax=Nocardia asteroides NBRC 15531 TaxID=1110697 RepID=U5EE57_NOCAS|nr:DUF3180 domain-containing protein [Nocardia asteroides]TLF62217.1 DUF3180 domain-containing protein [Nocardia asteroides NBRC 15531]UGT48184.1 DUF3180 domain-containing protein [Nocardia asteroides]SFN71518.1 Protein of unknown function [Nocardia asteroides]VEG32801.1 Protein of uncharacterised function (DUF3180) [Nocardia asteroides]GAD84666.1 hypothetical protein NCAST_25_00860 [Nocardia asteroides NBRC 15531]
MLKPTRVLDLALNVVVAAAIAWVATRFAYSTFPSISVAAGASLLPVAAIEVALGFVIKAKIADEKIGDGPEELHPINVARAVALAKASLQVGSIAAGVWLGFLLWVFPQRGTVTAAAADSPGAVVGMCAGSALVAAALWLEYCCRAPEEPPDEPATT